MDRSPYVVRAHALETAAPCRDVTCYGAGTTSNGPTPLPLTLWPESLTNVYSGSPLYVTCSAPLFSLTVPRPVMPLPPRGVVSPAGRTSGGQTEAQLPVQVGMLGGSSVSRYSVALAGAVTRILPTCGRFAAVTTTGDFTRGFAD